jgi:predicted transcriptional regulator
MSTTELRRLLIEKIQVTDDDKLLEEASRLLEVEIEEPDVYVLNDKQKEAIEEGRKQIINGEYLTDEESDKEIYEWLSKQPGL